MSVLEFGEHIAQDFEELVGIHLVVDLTGISSAHLIPVEANGFLLIGEEAVVFVDDAPQGLEIAHIAIVVFVLFHTR